MNDAGQGRGTGFATASVDLLMARMSMVNSAILVLYYLKQWDVYGPELGRARALLQRASGEHRPGGRADSRGDDAGVGTGGSPGGDE
jgi:hypothetical protein